CLVLLVRNRASVSIQLVTARPPACGVPFGDNAMHTVRREEAIFDPLPQRVLVHGIAEVQIRIAAILAQRSSRHPELHGRSEVLENASPGTVGPRTSAVTFVDYDQVEEVAFELLEQSFATLVFGERLIDREV